MPEPSTLPAAIFFVRHSFAAWVSLRLGQGTPDRPLTVVVVVQGCPYPLNGVRIRLCVPLRLAGGRVTECISNVEEGASLRCEVGRERMPQIIPPASAGDAGQLLRDGVVTTDG